MRNSSGNTRRVSRGGDAQRRPTELQSQRYKAVAGLTATVAENTLTLAWDGDRDEQLRLRLAIDQGTPTIREMAVRSKGGQWSTLGANLKPEYRIVSGLRRMTNQQLHRCVV